MIRSSLVLATLLLPFSAQAQDQDAAANTFYKAFYLDKAKSKDKAATAKAISLYTSFVSQNKDHALAGQAAANCVVLLYATGATKDAEAMVKAHGAMIAKAEAANPAADPMAQMMRGFGRGRGGRGGGGGGGEENPNAEMIQKLLGMHESADESAKGRIAAAITRLGGARDLMMLRFRGMRGGQGGGRGQGGRGRGRRGGGLTKPKIAEMSKDEAKTAVERMVEAAERLVDRMAANGQADEADALEAKLDKIQDLVDEGKLAEAQKVIDSIEVGNAGGRGGRGGQQGGRRRRGGDAGGQGGGAQGGAQGGGERRRRR